MDPARQGPVAGPGGSAQRDHLGGDLVRGDRDDSIAAEGEDRQRPRIVPGEDRDVPRPLAADPRDLLEVSRGLLDRHDPGMRCKPEERVGFHVGARARRDVVDDHGQAALVRHGPEMALEHALVRAVVVRRDDEGRVRAQLGGSTRRADRRVGVVRARAGDDGHAAASRARRRDLHRDLDEALALRLAQGGGLAGGPARDQAIDAGEDLPAHEAPEGGLVEGPFERERRDERGQGAADRRTGAAGIARDRGHRKVPFEWAARG